MKRTLAFLFTIILMSIFLSTDKGLTPSCEDLKANLSHIESVEQSISQGDNYIDLSGRNGSASLMSIPKPASKTAPTRRNILDVLLGIKIAVANLYSECSYSYSCNFPFDHQPQKELFFILRNIRI